MSVNPLTFEQIEAAERKALLWVPPWEAIVLMRLDDAILGALRGRQPTPPNTPDAPPEQISMKDGRGVRALMKGVMAKKAAQLGAKP